jgi:3-methyladenine DNA glycosylase AlkD
MKSFEHYHREVADALRDIGKPALGQAIQRDRGSQLPHLGISFPDLRRRVRAGFSFYTLPEVDVLRVWDALWRTSPWADVLFAALEYYAPIVRKRVSPGLWPVMRHWNARVDNWCHSDALSGVYARLLAHDPDEVLAQMAVWNSTDDLWLRRISLVSLINYTGKNAVYLPWARVQPLLLPCIDDPRTQVQMAVGWVLREMARAYPKDVDACVTAHVGQLSADAFARAISRMPAEAQTRLRALRAQRRRA